MKKLFLIFFILCFLGALAGGVFVVWGYHYITRDLPQLNEVADYSPPAASFVYASDGTPIAEFYEDERRYPVKIEEIPLIARNAFLAAEDASFYEHPGIDFVSIFRAFVKNLQTGSSKQGGSTITQQVVKNLLLTSEKTITRKLKEAILAYRIEQRLSKDDILEIYLNQIYFGNGAHGIKAAVKFYFHKPISEVTIAEAAMLAGLPKAPSRYSPTSNFKLAKRRQRYVLDRMLKAEFISPVEYKAALREEIEVYRMSHDNIEAAPYYVTEVRRLFQEKFPELDLDRDGLEIHTAVDLFASNAAKVALQQGLREVDKRVGWRGPINHLESEAEYRDAYHSQIPTEHEEGVLYPAYVKSLVAGRVIAIVGLKEVQLDLSKSAWAKKMLGKDGKVRWSKPEQELRSGDVVEVSVHALEGKESTPLSYQYKLDQTPVLEGAVVIVNPANGKVVADIGGYSFRRSKFNRVTQSYRQPGSAFKPIVYLAAVDGYRYTASTLVHDGPRTFKVGESYWTPGNYDQSYLGDIPLRSALEKSRNLVSADIISRIGVEAAIRYARKLGITSKLGRNLSLSLGSSEVTPLELARAYGVFANKGVLFPSVFIERVVDRHGGELYNYEDHVLEKAEQVISPQSAFLMAYLMKGVVDRGTGWRIREMKRPAAGKTGTSNDQMDAWYVGYTPEWAAAVWVGYDVKKTIGAKETGGRVASPIWLNAMKPFLDEVDRRKLAELEEAAKAEAEKLGIEYTAPEKLEPADFIPPEGVYGMWVSRESGTKVEPGTPGAIYEYFREGTAPPAPAWEEEATDYLSSPDL